jgi:hypothetical protein
MLRPIALSLLLLIPLAAVLAERPKPPPEELRALCGIWLRPGKLAPANEGALVHPVILPGKEKPVIPVLAFLYGPEAAQVILGDGVDGEKLFLQRNFAVHTASPGGKKNVLIFQRGEQSIEIEYRLEGDRLTLRAPRKIDGGAKLGEYEISGEWVRRPLEQILRPSHGNPCKQPAR